MNKDLVTTLFGLLIAAAYGYSQYRAKGALDAQDVAVILGAVGLGAAAKSGSVGVGKKADTNA